MNCINPRMQKISCIGLEMVKTYFKLFYGKFHSKCLESAICTAHEWKARESAAIVGPA